MEISEFAKGFSKLCFAFNQDFKEGQMLVYYERLGRFNPNAFNYAINNVIDGLKFFPKVSEILDAMQGYREVIPENRRLEANENIPTEMPEEIKQELKKYFSSF